MNPFLLALVGLLVVWLLPKFYRWCLALHHKLQLAAFIDGPPAIPLLGNALQVPRDTMDGPEYFRGLARTVKAKGGRVMRFWIADGLYVTPLDGEAAKDLIDSTEEITKGSDYNFLIPWLGTGLLISTGEKWKTRRRLLTPTFHFAMLDGYVDTFHHQTQRLIKILDNFEKKGIVDLFPFIKRCALDIICGLSPLPPQVSETAMGTTVNAQEHHNHPYVLAVEDMNEMAVIQERSDARKLKKLEVEKSGRKAFLDMLLEMQDTHKFSLEDIREEVDTFMFEGHDTTSSGIAWTMWCLATHPTIQEKVAEELFQVFGGSDRAATRDDLNKLDYLERCIKEAMRLFPPVPVVIRELQNDFKLYDKVVPKGSMLLVSIILLHRNSSAYKDVDSFNPDNFLPEEVSKRHPYDYVPFSAGLRNCIGQKFALLEEKLLVSSLLRRFRVSAEKAFTENRRRPHVVLRPEFGVPVLLERRTWS